MGMVAGLTGFSHNSLGWGWRGLPDLSVDYSGYDGNPQVELDTVARLGRLWRIDGC